MDLVLLDAEHYRILFDKLAAAGIINKQCQHGDFNAMQIKANPSPTGLDICTNTVKRL